MENRSFFLIEDDLEDIEIFQYALAEVSASLILRAVRDGNAAIELLKGNTFHPHYIFIDLHLPKMDGERCLAEIKQVSRLRDVPVYIYSGSRDEDRKRRLVLAGAKDIVQKPMTVSELSGRLREILRNEGDDLSQFNSVQYPPGDDE